MTEKCLSTTAAGRCFVLSPSSKIAIQVRALISKTYPAEPLLTLLEEELLTFR